MKIPYVKIYPADLLATSRKLTPEQIGQAILGLCEQAFENETAYQPQSQAEQALFDMLVSWKQESIAALKQKKNAGRSGAKKRWQKEREKAELSDGSTAIISANGRQKQKQIQKQSNITTYCEPAAAVLKKCRGNDNGNDKTANSRPAQGETGARVKTPLQNFSNAVIAEFEELETKDQIAVWFKRNARCLSDILRFCGGDIPTALATIRVCVERLEKAGLTGGYEAVCRLLPEYYQEAKKRLAGGVYAK